jgi:hypothetical protein
MQEIVPQFAGVEVSGSIPLAILAVFLVTVAVTFWTTE